MTTYTWKSAVSADWNPGDWSPAGPPDSATADVSIAAGSLSGYTVTIADDESIEVDSLTFGPGPFGTLALDGMLTLGGALAAMTIEGNGTVDIAGTLAGGTLTLENGVLDDTGAGTISSTLLFGGVEGNVLVASGQTLTLAGTVMAISGFFIAGPGTVLTTGATNINGGQGFGLSNGVTWLNSGTVTDAGSVGGSSVPNTISNLSGGIFDLTGTGGGGIGATVMNNAGLL